MGTTIATTTTATRACVQECLDTSVTIMAAPEAVWNHLVEARHLGAWFAERAAIDPTPGGAFVFGGRYTPGAPLAVQGVVRRLRASQELRFTWPIDGVETVVTMTLTASGGGTRLDLWHDGLGQPADPGTVDLYTRMLCFWGSALANLQALIERGRVGLRLDDAAPRGAIVEQSIEIDAPPARVWRALTEPEQLDRWVATRASVDPRPGGAYSYGWAEEGVKGYPVTVLAVDAPRRLVHTWLDRGREGRVVWTLEPLRDGCATRLTVRHEGYDGTDAEGYRIGWPEFLNRLWLLLDGERLIVRQSIWIAAPPVRVWQAFANADELARWFNANADPGTDQAMIYEPWVGGRVEFSGTHDVPYTFGGRVLVYDAPRELTFEWDWVPAEWAQPTLLTLRLLPQGDGTRVELMHHAFERIGVGAAKIYDEFAGGWDQRELLALKRVVDGCAG
jgi:uncharacterized protein YndB with AHSA1/START domain